jgi:Hexameric tyrosine-coordinated heme protein (HTHP)
MGRPTVLTVIALLTGGHMGTHMPVGRRLAQGDRREPYIKGCSGFIAGLSPDRPRRMSDLSAMLPFVFIRLRYVTNRIWMEAEMQLVPGNSLVTATPEDGRALAILLARNTIHAMQPDMEVLRGAREADTSDAPGLTTAAHVVSIEFATIAAANNYWR